MLRTCSDSRSGQNYNECTCSSFKQRGGKLEHKREKGERERERERKREGRDRDREGGRERERERRVTHTE